MKVLVRLCSQSVITIFRMLVVGILVTVGLIFSIDYFTSPTYGTNNLVMIVSAFAFLPLFLALFIEFSFASIRKEKRRKKRAKKALANQPMK